MAGYVGRDGVAASDGVAVGPVYAHLPGELKPERETISEGEVEEELGRLRSAVVTVVKKLSETADEMREGGSEGEAGIFEAHVEMAEDPEFLSGVEELVRGLMSPEAAVLAVGEEFAGMFAGMEDEYLAARADDVRDVASQIAAELMGAKEARFVLGDSHYNALRTYVRLALRESASWWPAGGGLPAHTDAGVEVRRVFHRLRHVSIESFNGHLKVIFEAHGSVRTRGRLDTARFAPGGVFVYQLALLYRHEQGLGANRELKAFLRAA